MFCKPKSQKHATFDIYSSEKEKDEDNLSWTKKL